MQNSEASIQISVVQSPKISPPTLKRPCTQSCPKMAPNNVWDGEVEVGRRGCQVNKSFSSLLHGLHGPPETALNTWFGRSVGRKGT